MIQSDPLTEHWKWASCESCRQRHISEAAKDGAGEREILEAVEVAFEMGIGPATVNGRFALEMMDSPFHGRAWDQE